jgi:5,5'-dehydrodivanillate O-demethylase
MWEGDPEDTEEWTIGHPQIWPGTAVVTYPKGWVQAQIRVPINDTVTAIYWYNAKLRSAGAAPRKECPVWENPFRKADGSYSVESLNGQDMMVMFTQGEIVDRSLEHLSVTDQGIVMYRRVLLQQLDKIARGEEPLGVVRDEAKNTPFIALPVERHVEYALTGVAVCPDVVWEEAIPDEVAG